VSAESTQFVVKQQTAKELTAKNMGLLKRAKSTQVNFLRQS
jgi:hypothetical protein